MNQKSQIEKYLLWLIYALIFITPIIFIPVVYRQFDIGKSVPFKIGISLIAIIFAVKEIIKPTPDLWSKKFKPFLPFAIPTALYILSYLFSTFMCDDIWMSLVGLYERQIGTTGFLASVVLGVLLVLFIRNNKDYELGVNVLKIMTALLAFASVLQFFGIYSFGLPSPPAGRSNALLGNANFLANQIVFLAPFFLSSCFLATERIQKMFHLFLFALCGLGIMATGTRGAYLAYGAAFLTFIFLLVLVNDKEEKFKTNYRLLLGLFGLLGFVAGTLIAMHFDSFMIMGITIPFCIFLTWAFFRLANKYAGKVWKKALPLFLAVVLGSAIVAAGASKLRYENATVDRYYSLFDFSGKATPRFMIWKDGMTFIKDIPLWGVGPELFREKFMSYKSKDTEILEPHTHYDNPHNNYLYILFSLGGVGLALHLWIMFRFFRLNLNLINDSKQSRQVRLMASGFFAVFISYAVWTIPGFEFLSSIITFWALIGLFSVFYFSVKGENHSWDLELFSRIHKVFTLCKQRAFQLSSYVVLILLSSWLVWDNYNIFMGDVSFVQGLMNRGRGQFYDSIDNFEEALSYNPRESYYYLHIGKSYADLIRRESDYDLKKRYLAKAEIVLDKGLDHAWSPDLIYATKANLHLGVGDRQGALDAMTKVLEVYPATIEYRKFINYILNDAGK